MDNKTKKEIINRISYLLGHLEGIKKMVEEDKYCICIIDQNKAVVSAIRKVNELILKNHLNTCVLKAIRGDDKKEREDKINELLKVFKGINDNI